MIRCPIEDVRCTGVFVVSAACYAPDMSYVMGLRHVVLRIASAAFGAATLFFAWYCIRLAWVWGTHRANGHGGGMYIGAVAFPAAVLVFGWLARTCWRRSRQPVHSVVGQ